MLVAGAVGAVTGGVGGRLATSAAKGAITTATAVKRTAAVGGVTSASGSAAQSLLNGEVPGPKNVAISGAVGTLTVGVGAKIGNAPIAKLEKMADAGGLAENIANTTRTAITGRAAESTTSTLQKAGQVVVDAVAAPAQQKIEDQLER